ncbi:hypothetical protein [Janibacter anophelis]|uniref:hypothetical protein n=1 Tax=Janibacter anophelis TaxID=319054 RepID=UPI000DEFCD28|nr:hypothetical protein [Janibacter anophelis]
MTETYIGQVRDVTPHAVGADVAEPTPAGASAVPVFDTLDLPEGPTSLRLPDGSLVGAAGIAETSVLLAVPLPVALEAMDRLEVPSAREHVAVVDVDGEPMPARVEHTLVASLPIGVRGGDMLSETVRIERDGSGFLVVEVLDKVRVDIWGDPSGRAVEVDQDGIVIYDVGAEGERFVSSSLGGFGADALLLTNELGKTLAGFTSDGFVVAQGGSFADDVSIAGTPLVGEDGWLDSRTMGAVAHGELDHTTAYTEAGWERGYGALGASLAGGRLYSVEAYGSVALEDWNALARMRLRYSWDDVTPTVDASAVMNQGTSDTPTTHSNHGSLERYFYVRGLLHSDVDRNVNILLTYQGRGSRASGRGAVILVNDLGPRSSIVGTGVPSSGGRGASSGGTQEPPTSTKKTYVSTWRASQSGTYLGNGTRRSTSAASGDLVQGYYSGLGSQRGGAVFEDTASDGEVGKTQTQALSGAQLVKAELYLYCSHTWNSSGGTVMLGPLGSHGLPSTLSSSQVGSSANGGKIKAGEARWFSIPVSWFGGSNGGVVIGNGTTQNMEYYVRLNGHTDDPTWHRPRLRLTYER